MIKSGEEYLWQRTTICKNVEVRGNAANWGNEIVSCGWNTAERLQVTTGRCGEESKTNILGVFLDCFEKFCFYFKRNEKNIRDFKQGKPDDQIWFFGKLYNSSWWKKEDEQNWRPGYCLCYCAMFCMGNKEVAVIRVISV